MKQLPLILTLLGLFAFESCQKRGLHSVTANERRIKSAEAYFGDAVQGAVPVSKDGRINNLRTQTARKPLWEQAYVMRLQPGNSIVVPIHYEKELFVQTTQGGNHLFSLDNTAKLLLYQDAAMAWHAEMVTLLPDTVWLNNCHAAFSGIVLVEDWWGNPLDRLLYGRDGSVKRYTAAGQGKAPNSGTTVNRAVELSSIVAECYSMTGYNYSAGDPDGGIAWSEDLGCDYYAGGYTDINYSSLAPTGGSVGGNLGYGIVPDYSGMFIIPPPTNAIASISDYFKCFTNDPGASYQVAVCVNQPQPGSRTPWKWALNSGSSSGSNFVDVGHVFLVLTQTTGGTTITRNVGFYPSVNVSPFSSAAQGTLDDNENDIYNISASFSVNNSMFFNILGYIPIGSSPGYNYDVNSNNCTTFAINALAAGHIYLPSTTGYWIGGLGNDPGDLGEDIRSHDFSGMTRSTTYSSHANVGTCN